MQGKYHGNMRFQIARWQRWMLRVALRPTVRWQPLAEPHPGYSVLIGALASMPSVLEANLRMLQQQRRDHLHEVIVVFDRPRHALPSNFERDLRASHPDLPLRLMFYSRTQARLLQAISWGWCYSWLSWCMGIAACRTRYALLHDLDALLLRSDILEERYRVIRERGHEYLGREWYNGNGIVPEDQLAVTFELMFDVQSVRERFAPVELFNHVDWFRGRRVEFDTFLHAQSRHGRASTLAIDPEDLVHPSQVFCQYTALTSQRRYVPPERNNLPMLPYLLYLGGDGDALARETHAMSQRPNGQATLFGRPMDVSRLSHRHVDWLVTQVTRVEWALAGELRPEVRDYFDALRRQVPISGSATGQESTAPNQAAAAQPASARVAAKDAKAQTDRPASAAARPLRWSSRQAEAVPASSDALTSFGGGQLATTVAEPGPWRAGGHALSQWTPRSAMSGADQPTTAEGVPTQRPDSQRPDNEPTARFRQRVVLHGVAVDVMTERGCVQHVCHALDKGRGGWIITPNLDHLVRAQRDEPFRAMLREADLVVADGMPLVWASRLQGTPLPERVAGSTMVSTLAAAAAERGRSLFLLGGEPGAAEAAGKVLIEQHPGLRVVGTSCPAMGFEQDAEQMQALRNALRDARPDIVYVALGSPKQERVIRELRRTLPGTWWIGVGISLSFLSGQVRRAPVWMQRLGIEWAHRLIQEPRRLARRYLLEGLPFAARLLGRAAMNRLRGVDRRLWQRMD